MPETIAWKKTILDREFRSEGCAIADVNGDGRPDILAGNLWYEAPHWAPHLIRPAERFDPATGYSNSFLNWAWDVDGDGRPDQVVVGFPGREAVWRRNPGGSGLWDEFVICGSACNESPTCTDLLGSGERVLVCGFEDRVMAWFAPGPDATREWARHEISDSGAPGTQRYGHGLGVGDLGGDGREEVLTTKGYWRQANGHGHWDFVPADLGPACAQMLVYDVDGDGLADVITSSAHEVGIWWWRQERSGHEVRFQQRLLDDSFSQSHALVLADINGDGLLDLVAGKRFWAHGPTGDVDPNAPAVLYWYELRRDGGEVAWVPRAIDDDSGVGTQFEVADVNGDGLLDVVTANKKGVFLFEQVR